MKSSDGKQIRLTTHEHHLKAFLENEFYKTGNIDAQPSLYLDQVALFSTLKNQSLGSVDNSPTAYVRRLVRGIQ